VIVTLVLSTVATAVIAYALRGTIGLRATAEVETAGLDVSEHGEEAYID
jgi:ammonium transporter, Amt family